jgi:hypothetical protein
MTHFVSHENSVKNSNTTVHTPIESKPNAAESWVPNVKHVVENYIINTLDDSLSKSGCVPGNLEMLKANLEKISSKTQNPLYTGFYTPEQVGITDLSNDSTSVPRFKKTVVNPETGLSETFQCTNMRKAVDVYRENYEHVIDKI